MESSEPLYKDSNGDGIPDAFENRPSIIEILNDDISPSKRTENDIDPNAEYRFVPTDGGVVLEVFGSGSSGCRGQYKEGRAVI